MPSLFKTLSRPFTQSQFHLTKRCLRAYSDLALKLYDGLVSGDRYALSRSITLVESSLLNHRRQSQDLLSLILARGQTAKSTFRIGLSGSPGVGKSTFIEVFGMLLLEHGHRVAVLAVDPSSMRTGGSILGDKTRMTELSRADDAYVRPSPTRGTLGGVARNTNEAIILCEAAGYDITLVETVGVGQSETMVAEIVDMFVLLVPPAGGDELQGLKKGIVEHSDLVIVNKADGVLADAARVAAMEYTSALKFVQANSSIWKPEVIQLSSIEQKGIGKAWETMQRFYTAMMTSGELDKKRGEQRKLWMWRQITSELIDRLNADVEVKQLVQTLESRVIDGKMTSGMAAEEVANRFLDRARRNGL